MRRWLRRRVATLVRIHTTTDQSIEGLLKVAAADGLVLTSARFLSGEGSVDLPGDTFVPRERVSLVQVLAPDDRV